VLFVVSDGAAARLAETPTDGNVLLAFRRLLGGFVEGHHIVLMAPAACKLIECSPNFSEYERAGAKQIRNKYADFGGLEGKVSHYAEVVEDGVVPVVRARGWTVPLAWLAPRPLQSSQLICEDYNDANCYLGAAQDSLSLTGLHSFKVQLRPLLGGGANTGRVLSRTAVEEQLISVCIADSDRKAPGAPLGASAQACLAVHGDGLFVTEVTHGRSAENTLPWRLIDKVRSGGRAVPSETLARMHRHESCAWYLDFKRGLCGYHVRQLGHAGSRAYWTAAAAVLAGAPRCCPTPCNGASESECRYWVDRGFGGDLLADVAAWLARNMAPNRSNAYLPSPNDNDWRRLGSLVAAFGLGGSPKRI
jgi:hypothetical protein